MYLIDKFQLLILFLFVFYTNIFIDTFKFIDD